MYKRQFLARASSDTATKAVCKASGEKEAAMPMGCGKTVAKPLRATPCNASSVSYTHLDVYKRQRLEFISILRKILS